jgi:hypothetical protein
VPWFPPLRCADPASDLPALLSLAQQPERAEALGSRLPGMGRFEREQSRRGQSESAAALQRPEQGEPEQPRPQAWRREREWPEREWPERE